MEKFLEQYDSKISGVISTFDRMIFKGHIMSFFKRATDIIIYFKRRYCLRILGSMRRKCQGKLEVVIRERRCLFLYFYYQHKEFGFMHARLQTWFPFQIQIYINGREWLTKQLDGKGIGYQRYDNSIVQVDDVKRAQEIAGQFIRVNFAKAFDAISRQINPVMLKYQKLPMGVIWGHYMLSHH
jgi:hypothetical protein